jgi:hypothetical protein
MIQLNENISEEDIFNKFAWISPHFSCHFWDYFSLAVQQNNQSFFNSKYPT